MNKLKIFLEESFSALKEWRSLKNIHIVLGNESCDLDSTISSLAYGYLLSEKLNSGKSSEVAVFPVLNVSAEDFAIRVEHCTLLKNVGIDLNKLIYRSKLKLDELIKEKKDSIKSYLVDHHVLSKNDEILKDTVCRIFDHRPINLDVKWSSTVRLRIEPVGSCATLITDEFFNDKQDLSKELAHLLYCTIVFDTLGLLPENKKATPLDIETAKKLETKFNFNESRLELFQKIVKLHSDVSHLTPHQLLIRDLKYVDNIPLPSLPMLVESFLKLHEVEKSLEDMGAKKKTPFIVLIGIEAKPDVKRDVALFFTTDEVNSKHLLVNFFKNRSEFQFEEISCNVNNVVLLRQLNIQHSRKQVIPIVQEFLQRQRNILTN